MTVRLSVPSGSIAYVHGTVTQARLRGRMLEVTVEPDGAVVTRLDHSFSPVISQFVDTEITQIPVEVM